jgi:hypothetical protein
MLLVVLVAGEDLHELSPGPEQALHLDTVHRCRHRPTSCLSEGPSAVVESAAIQRSDTGARGRTLSDVVRRRLVTFGLLSVVAAAVYGHLMEMAGRVACACEPSCWCKKPGISLFRWVTPNAWHRIWQNPEAKA